MNIAEEIKKKLNVSAWQEKKKRVYFSIDPKDVPEMAKVLWGELGGRYVILSGIDTPKGIEILYHFAFDQAGLVVTGKTIISREKPEVPSIAPIIAGAAWIEREIKEILGVNFIGHPGLKRFILPEDWPEKDFPLRSTK